MKVRTIVFLCLLVLAAGSCIPSLFPLYTAEDLIADDRLTGRWEEYRNQDYVWEITRETPGEEGGIGPIFHDVYDDMPEPTYRLEGTPKWGPESSESALHLFALGGHKYLNLYPTDWELDHEFLSWHMVEAHVFTKIRFLEDTLIISFFNGEYLAELIGDNRIKISHVKLDDRIFLTASTKELQKFVLKYGNDPRAFAKSDTLVRLPSVRAQAGQ